MLFYVYIKKYVCKLFSLTPPGEATICRWKFPFGYLFLNYSQLKIDNEIVINLFDRKMVDELKTYILISSFLSWDSRFYHFPSIFACCFWKKPLLFRAISTNDLRTFSYLDLNFPHTQFN